MNSKTNHIFAKRIFWDLNFEPLDYFYKASFVIERVFERSDIEDIRHYRRYYGDEIASKALLKVEFCGRVLKRE